MVVWFLKMKVFDKATKLKGLDASCLELILANTFIKRFEKLNWRFFTNVANKKQFPGRWIPPDMNCAPSRLKVWR